MHVDMRRLLGKKTAQGLVELRREAQQIPDVQHKRKDVDPTSPMDLEDMASPLLNVLMGLFKLHTSDFGPGTDALRFIRRQPAASGSAGERMLYQSVQPSSHCMGQCSSRISLLYHHCAWDIYYGLDSIFVGKVPGTPTDVWLSATAVRDGSARGRRLRRTS
ncbi:hypothetical protein OC842_006499 [Tilletia horrida]|uniref:Uncharacterized protein n=1 Tax=Tilletia horrida TaxID=155126 RepID=A0AAN6G5V7_9BASI|nr:hypothetical protein OC842_006499 [Tilletia horrida]